MVIYLLFLTSPMLLGYETCNLCKMGTVANPSQVRSHFPRDIWISYKLYLVHCQSEDSCAHEVAI